MGCCASTAAVHPIASDSGGTTGRAAGEQGTSSSANSLGSDLSESGRLCQTIEEEATAAPESANAGASLKLMRTAASDRVIRAQGYDFDHDPYRYSKPIAVFSELVTRRETGDLPPVRLLKSSWLLERAAKAKACRTSEERKRYVLPRRQDLERLEPDAFYSAQEVAQMMPTPKRMRQVMQLNVVSVSHCWETPSHPDPACRTLLNLAHAITLAQSRPAPTATGGRMMTLPTELAVFFDWCSLPQHAVQGGTRRSAPEELAFRAALSRMQLWYAHQVCPLHAHPFHAHPRHAHPLHAHPLHAHPFHAHPRHAHPRHAHPRHAPVSRAHAHATLPRACCPECA